MAARGWAQRQPRPKDETLFFVIPAKAGIQGK
jgi:hypothetical protein